MPSLATAAAPRANRLRRSAAAGLVIVAASWAAAAEAPRIGETWRAPRVDARKFSKVLVVGITTDDGVRRAFEDKFASHLRGRGIECLTSHPLVPDLRDIGPPAEVADRLLSREVDAVITVRLVAPERYEGETGAELWQQDLVGEVLVRPYVEAAVAAGAPATGKVVADVGLWDLATRGRVWAARTEPATRKLLRRRAGEIVQDVILRLRDDGAL